MGRGAAIWKQFKLPVRVWIAGLGGQKHMAARASDVANVQRIFKNSIVEVLFSPGD